MFSSNTQWSRKLTKKIKRVKIDSGWEYDSNPFNSFYEDYEIIHETLPYSPKSKRVVERKNRALKDMMNAMLIKLQYNEIL